MKNAQEERTVKNIFGFLIPVLVLMMAPPAMAGDISPRSIPGSPPATVQLTGEILVVTPSVAFESATLRVAGPESYEAITWSRGEPLVIDLAADGFFSDSEKTKTSMPNLLDGRYGYEVVFHLAGGERRTHDGTFFLDGGAARNPSDERTYSTATPEGLGSDEAGGLTNVTAPSTSADDSVDISDTAGDGQTNVYMRSTAPGELDDPGRTWRVTNDQGSFRLIAGLPQLNNEIKPFTVTTGKQVGLGTTQPQAEVHIAGPGGILRIEDSDACTGTLTNPNYTDPSSWEIEEDQGRLMFELQTKCDFDFDPDLAGGKVWITRLGNVGIGTRDPTATLTIHQEDHGGDMRLTGAGQTYTLGIRGGSGELVVQGASGVSQEVVRIRHDAPADSLVVDPAGIGIGTGAPTADLTIHDGSDGGDLQLTGGGGQYKVGIRGDSGDFVVQGDGGTFEDFLRIRDGSPDEAIVIDPAGVGIGTANPGAMLHVVGNAVLEGDIALGSSRTIKHDIERLDGAEVLGAVRDLPLYFWKYKDDPAQATHVGPMAEDFHASFRLGRDDKHLSPADSAGLALAAVQGLDRTVSDSLGDLQAMVDLLAARNRELGSENDRLRARLAAIEARLEASPVDGDRRPE